MIHERVFFGGLVAGSKKLEARTLVSANRWLAANDIGSHGLQGSCLLGPQSMLAGRFGDPLAGLPGLAGHQVLAFDA